MSFGIIYKATNKINGKYYIGQTVKSLAKRKYKHENANVDYYFNRALKKYGKDNFEWIILNHCSSKEEMDKMESNYIKQYNTFGSNGYNLSYGGEGSPGRVLSEETRAKISRKALGRVISEETRQKISEANKGKRLSPEAASKRLTNLPRGANHAFFGVFGKDNPTSKRYVITNEFGDNFVIKGIQAFCKKYKLDASHLVACAKGKRNYHKGYKCRYYDENKDINIMEEENNAH